MLMGQLSHLITLLVYIAVGLSNARWLPSGSLIDFIDRLDDVFDHRPPLLERLRNPSEHKSNGR